MVVVTVSIRMTILTDSVGVLIVLAFNSNFILVRVRWVGPLMILVMSVRIVNGKIEGGMVLVISHVCCRLEIRIGRVGFWYLCIVGVGLELEI